MTLLDGLAGAAGSGCRGGLGAHRVEETEPRAWLPRGGGAFPRVVEGLGQAATGAGAGGGGGRGRGSARPRGMRRGTDCRPSSDRGARGRGGRRHKPGKGSFRDDGGQRVATERSPAAWCPASRRRGEAQSRGGEPRGREEEGLLRAERPSWSLAWREGGGEPGRGRGWEGVGAGSPAQAEGLAVARRARAGHRAWGKGCEAAARNPSSRFTGLGPRG